MKNLNLIFAFVLLFASLQLFAQKKWTPYSGFVIGKDKTFPVYPAKKGTMIGMTGAMIGIAIENPTKNKSIFFDYGLELTYLRSSEGLDSEVNCINCDPAFFLADGYKRRYLELAMPILLKFKLLDKKRSTLNIKSGYAPTFSLPINSYYYRVSFDFAENTAEKVIYKNERKYIHTYYLGIDYRLKIKENLGLEFSPIFKYQILKYGSDKEKQFQYGLATRVVFNF
ncbi:MAG: hypothetical protein AB8H03_12920 [Saprospiraceae bacterium]